MRSAGYQANSTLLVLDGEMPLDDFVEKNSAHGESYRALVKNINSLAHLRGFECHKTVLSVESPSVRFHPNAQVIPKDNQGDAVMAAGPDGERAADEYVYSEATDYEQIFQESGSSKRTTLNSSATSIRLEGRALASSVETTDRHLGQRSLGIST